MEGNVRKWKKAFREHNKWNGRSARRVQKLEAKIILKWLTKLDRAEYRILEIGCGNGLVGRTIIEGLKKSGKVFSYHFTDLLNECIELTKKTIGNLEQESDIKLSLLDVYEADESLGENTQDIIVSTGFASAASYRGSVPMISKILKEDGILICDFVNHLSPFLLLRRPHYLFQYLFNSKSPLDSYHFGIIGIRNFFKNHDLVLVQSDTLTWKRTPLLCMFQKRSKVEGEN